MEIRHLKSHQVDRDKWDACIRNAFNGVVYAYAWYLEYVTYEWEVLIADDYDIVMPLPIERSWGIRRIVMSDLLPVLGIFSAHLLSDEKIMNMLGRVPYSNMNYVLNAYNKVQRNTNVQQVRYPVMDLIPSLNRMKNGFSLHCQQILQKIEERGISVTRSLDVKGYIDFRNRNIKFRKADSLIKLKQLISFAVRYKSAGLYGAYDSFNELIAAAFVIKANNSLFIIDSVLSSRGQDEFGLHAIIYHMIRNNAESNLTIQFTEKLKSLGEDFSISEHECQKIIKGFGAIGGYFLSLTK